MTFDDCIIWTLGGNITLDGSICKLDWFINIIGTPITDCGIHKQSSHKIHNRFPWTDSAQTDWSMDPLLVAYSELDFHFVFDRLALASQQILRHLLTELPKAELSVDSSRLIFSFLVHFRSFWYQSTFIFLTLVERILFSLLILDKGAHQQWPIGVEQSANEIVTKNLHISSSRINRLMLSSRRKSFLIALKSLFTLMKIINRN